MGKRGPPKKPTKILEARGSWLLTKRKKEPQPDKSNADCPEWVSEHARPHWPKIQPTLERMDVWTSADIPMLGLLVDSLAKYIEDRDQVNREGSTYKTKAGFRLNPAVNARNASFDRLFKCLCQFGLSPASRAGLSVEHADEKEDDGLDKLLASA